MDLIPINLKSNQMALNNCVYISSKLAKDPNAVVHVRIKDRIMKCMFSPIIEETNLGASKNIREYLGVDVVHAVKVEPTEPMNPSKYGITVLKIEWSIKKNPQNIEQLSHSQVLAYFRDKQTNMVLNRRQSFYVKVGSVICQVVILAILLGKKEGQYGLLTPDTTIKVFVDGKEIKEQEQEKQLGLLSRRKQEKLKKLQKVEKTPKQQEKTLFKAGFKAEEMGIGGLDEEIFNIFRRVFASRRFSNQVVNRFGVKHVKGILLYGPPGTGKTLIARQFAKALDIKEGNLKIINGPEIFSKFVGESEENIRKLFAKAREDQSKYGPKSPQHIIVFDEIDAICKQRGVYSGGTNVNDQVVNQLLSVIDGVDALNNIIVIGMTNRKDLIDEAILRPGRFQVHIQVSLPDAKGRQQIINIHTAKLKANNLLNNDLKIEDLAKMTKNYTGAQIEALVKCAASFAIMRSTNVMDFSAKLKIDEKNLPVKKEDFLKALEEVKPQFGIDEDKFNCYFREKVINYGGSYETVTDNLNEVAQFGDNGRCQVKSVLLYGATGSGKTTIAANFAKHCSFPYIKIISPENFVGQSDAFKIQSMNKIFEDAYKTSRACIVIDNIERLIEYTAVGRRFSNQILQTLLVLCSKVPSNAQSKLLILGTTSCFEHLQRLGVPSCFTNTLEVPILGLREITTFLQQKYNLNESVGSKIGNKLKGASIRNLIEVAGLVQNIEDVNEWVQCYKILISTDAD